MVEGVMHAIALSQPGSRRPSSGIAALEFVIALPLLGLLLLVTLETGRLLHQYMLLSHIAGTAVRSGIQLAGLGEGCFEMEEGNEPVLLNLGYAPNQPSDGRLAPHWFAQRRAQILLFHNKERLLVRGDMELAAGHQGPDMASEYVRDTEEEPSAACESVIDAGGKHYALRNSFAVRLEGEYTPMVFPIGFPLRVESRASYLSQNSNFPLAGGPPCRPRPIT